VINYISSSKCGAQGFQVTDIAFGHFDFKPIDRSPVYVEQHAYRSALGQQSTHQVRTYMPAGAGDYRCLTHHKCVLE